MEEKPPSPGKGFVAKTEPVDAGPLSGLRVVVTRAAEQQGELAAKLSALGAEVVSAPVIRIAPPSDGGSGLKDATAHLHLYDWVVFTSANGVDAFFALLGGRSLPAGVRIAVVGAATRRAVESHGRKADFVPSKFVGDALAEEFPATSGSALLVQARQARKVVAEGLAAKGIRVRVVEAYQTLPFHPDQAGRAQVESADAICFTSSSTVTGFLEVYGPEAVPPLAVSIGPVTTATAEQAGVRLAATAENHDLDGLVRALERAVGGRGATE
ncbi:MAG: uroporphyrinogen-III synthase [Actinomycetota bacterium]|nr:uroporphyrinogen-III synthase [Actinomycetota bacterium]